MHFCALYICSNAICLDRDPVRFRLVYMYVCECGGESGGGFTIFIRYSFVQYKGKEIMKYCYFFLHWAHRLELILSVIGMVLQHPANLIMLAFSAALRV